MNGLLVLFLTTHLILLPVFGQAQWVANTLVACDGQVGTPNLGLNGGYGGYGGLGTNQKLPYQTVNGYIGRGVNGGLGANYLGGNQGSYWGYPTTYGSTVFRGGFGRSPQTRVVSYLGGNTLNAFRGNGYGGVPSVYGGFNLYGKSPSNQVGSYYNGVVPSVYKWPSLYGGNLESGSNNYGVLSNGVGYQQGGDNNNGGFRGNGAVNSYGGVGGANYGVPQGTFNYQGGANIYAGYGEAEDNNPNEEAGGALPSYGSSSGTFDYQGGANVNAGYQVGGVINGNEETGRTSAKQADSSETFNYQQKGAIANGGYEEGGATPNYGGSPGTFDYQGGANFNAGYGESGTSNANGETGGASTNQGSSGTFAYQTGNNANSAYQGQEANSYGNTYEDVSPTLAGSLERGFNYQGGNYANSNSYTEQYDGSTSPIRDEDSTGVANLQHQGGNFNLNTAYRGDYNGGDERSVYYYQNRGQPSPYQVAQRGDRRQVVYGGGPNSMLHASRGDPRRK